MIRRHTTALRASLMAADFLAALALFVIASLLRYGADWEVDWQRLGLHPWLAALAYGGGWVTLVLVNGLYRVRARYAFRSEAIALIRAGLVLGVGTVVYLFVGHVSDASRLLIVGLVLATLAVAILARLVLRTALGRIRRDGRMTRFVLVAGAGSAGAGVCRPARAAYRSGPPGARPPRRSRRRSAAPSRPVLGTLDDIETVLHARVVDEVAICLPVGAWNYAEPITRLCASEGKIVRIPADGGPNVAGGYAEEFDGQSITSLVYGPDRAIGLLAKRVLDVVFAALGLVLAAPLFAAIAVYVWRRDGRPVLYRQRRIGLNGRPFELLKFRTMQPDAEQQTEQLALFNEVRGRAFKITHDPRLTRSGRVLRRTSLDELPQLLNVLRGEMSIVGPRPPLPGEVEGYDVWHRRRLSMKPGITGLWQVSARNNPDFDQWVERDLEYIDSWSLWLDVKILLRTLPALVSQPGR